MSEVRCLSVESVDRHYYNIDPDSILDSMSLTYGFTSASYEKSTFIYTSVYGYLHFLYGCLLVCLVFAGFFIAPLGKMLCPGPLVAILRLVCPSLVSYVLLSQTQRITCNEVVVAPHTRYRLQQTTYFNEAIAEDGKVMVPDQRNPLVHHEVAPEPNTRDTMIFHKYKFSARPFVYSYNLIDNLAHIAKIIRELFLPAINVDLFEDYMGRCVVSQVVLDMLINQFGLEYHPENQSVHSSYVKSLKRLNLDYDTTIARDSVEFYENFCRYESQRQHQITYYKDEMIWAGEGFQASQGPDTKGAT